MVIEVGRTATYRITADVAESEASHYNLSIDSDPSIAVASPDNFNAFNFGEFVIRGVSPGTNQFVFEWSYQPNNAEGFCVLQVIVVPRGSTVQTAANHPQSGHAGDPVNTLTGEFLLQEEPDLQLFGPMPLYFSRFYASGLQAEGQAHGSLGPNWLHNFDYRLEISTDHAEVITERGRRIPFQRIGGAWVLQTTGSVPFQLVEEGELYLFGDVVSKRVFIFNKGGQLTKIEDGKGNSHALTYAGNVLASVNDGLGRELLLSYFGLQQLSRVTVGTRVVRFSFGFTGELNTVRDVAGSPVNYSYANPAESALLTARSLPLGNSHYTNSYDAVGRLKMQKDAYGSAFTYGFGTNFTTVTDPLGGIEKHTHDANGQLITATDEANHSIQLGYDANGNRTSIRDREGGVTLMAYGNGGKVSAITNADNTVVRYSYQPRTYRGITFHDLAKVEYPDGTSESYRLDTAGNVLFLTNRQGSVWSYTYNDRGQVLAATNPTGGVKNNTYNPNGSLASLSADGNSVHFEYDSLGRLVREEHADGTKRLFARDLLDRLTLMTNELGGVFRYSYDANGNLASRTHPNGLVETNSFDKMDRLISIAGPSGVDAELTFDALGRTASLVLNGSETNRFAYDAVGNLIEVEDGEGSSWLSAYDAEGVLRQSINPLNRTNLFETDAMGRVTALTSTKGNTRRTSYDEAGRIKTVTAPDGLVTTHEYSQSLLASLTLGSNGLSNTFAHNPLGRETELKDPSGSVWKQEFESHGRRVAGIDPLGKRTVYEYDARDRVSRAIFPESLGTAQIEYDGLNAITRRLYSDGTDLRYEYDSRGHLTNANGIRLGRDLGGLITQCNGIEISRASQKQIASINYAPGKTVTYQYNKRGQVTEMSDWLGGTFQFQYDAAGRLIRIDRPEGGLPTKSHSYITYDDENRVSALVHTNQTTVSLIRDVNGRVTNADRDLSGITGFAPSVSSYSFDSAHQLQGATYDALGRVISDGVRTCRWDLASRLIEYSETGATTTNAYDASGYRLSRQRGTEVKNYVWNYGMGVPSILITRDGSGADRWYYLYTPGGQLVASIDAATHQRYCYFFDENGNTLFVTNESGEAVCRYTYGPYGESLGSNAQIDNPFTFQGKYGVMHEGNGLYYLRARWYDSGACRFLSRDPLKSNLPKAANPYQYALNNPLRYNDPLGLQSVDSQDVPTPNGEAPASGRQAVQQKGLTSSSEESDPVSTASQPSSGVVYLTHEEWNTEVRRVKRLLHDRVKKAEWGWVDPEVPGNFDSAFLKRQKERFYFRGLVMNGGELNYYFQGMYWKELGVPKGVMIGIIYAYKHYKYHNDPSPFDLYAACNGYEDNANFWTEMRDEALHYGEIISSVPESLGEVVMETGSSIYNWGSSLIPSFGE